MRQSVDVFVARELLRTSATAVLGAAAVGAIVASIRTFPTFVDAGGLVAAAVFVDAMASALEVAVFFGAPLGAALGLSWSAERGQLRALSALGVPPFRLVRAAMPLAAAATLIVALSAHRWGDLASHPGRRFGKLVHATHDEAGQRCSSGSETPIVVGVPFLPMSWVCDEGGPLLVGTLPGASRVAFTARSLEVDDAASTVTLAEVVVVAETNDRRSDGSAHQLKANRLQWFGITSWHDGLFAKSPLTGSGRALVLASLCGCAVLTSAWLVASGATRRRSSSDVRRRTVVSALAVGVVVAGAPWLVFSAVEPLAVGWDPTAAVALLMAAMFVALALAAVVARTLTHPK